MENMIPAISNLINIPGKYPFNNDLLLLLFSDFILLPPVSLLLLMYITFTFAYLLILTKEIKNISECKSGMILTAGRYTVEEGFRGHSVFTYTILDALSGIADQNKNGFIEINELAQYVQAIVPAIAKYEFDRHQMPYIDQCGGDLQFKKIPRE